MEEHRRRTMGVAKAAKELDSSKFTLYDKIKKGELPAYRLGRKILVNVDELLEAMRMK